MMSRLLRLAFWPALGLLLGLVVVACVEISVGPGSSGDPAASEGPAASESSAAPGASSAVSPQGSSSLEPQPSESGVPTPSELSAPTATRRPGPVRIGYISIDERVPFARSVTESVRVEAARLGVELLVCDSALTASGALDCAEQLGTASVDGVISFQAFPDVATDVCIATGDVPTVGVAYGQGPCEVSRVHLDQAESGRVAGDAVGRFARDQWDCDVDAYVSLEASAAGADAAARMDGYRDGFAAQCQLPEDRTIVLDGADRVATAETQLARTLERLKGDHIVVVGLTEDAILGAIRAATEAGRQGDLFYSGQGADPSIRQTIACDPQYIASVAHFPERYGALAMTALLDSIEGREVASTIDAPFELVTSTNVRSLFPDTAACEE